MSPTNTFLKTNQVSVIGVPFNGGQPRGGVEHGPAKLVEFGLLQQIEELNWSVKYHDHKEAIEKLKPAEDPDVQNLKKPKYVSATTQYVAGEIQKEAEQGHFILTLGGDHSIALATVSGVLGAHPDACVIWVDAHAVSNGIMDKEWCCSMFVCAVIMHGNTKVCVPFHACAVLQNFCYLGFW